MSTKFTTVDEYIASFPKETQTILENIRKIAREVAPAGVEAISYQIAALKLNGTSLVHFAGFKKHVSLFPAFPDTHPLMKELAPFLHGAATVQFPLDKEIPYDLVKRFIEARLEQHPKK